MPTPTQAQTAKPAPFPFSVGFPLSIRPMGDKLAICGANRGEGWPILCLVPIDTFHDADAASIVKACTAHVDNSPCLAGSTRAENKALRAALSKAHRYLADNEADMQAAGDWGDDEQDTLEAIRAALSGSAQ